MTAPSNATLNNAYKHCRKIARQRARNFYYAFIALPPRKRDAICAVYAFMRQADDISDDPSLSIEQRRNSMAAWLATWKQAESGSSTTAPVFLALRDAQQRFAIPSEWLDQLVQGTTLDLERRTPIYATFDDLYHYCYLVASVVGLVSIRIFGYQDPRAEKLAEETGIAFQLTNILRDVKEDAAMGRVYIPRDELARSGLAAADVLQDPQRVSLRFRAVLQDLAAKARQYYRSADELLPLVNADSRAALWVLVTIYRRLLDRIQSSGYDVFSAKITVPSYEKLAILAQGTAKALSQRAVHRQSE